MPFTIDDRSSETVDADSLRWALVSSADGSEKPLTRSTAGKPQPLRKGKYVPSGLQAERLTDVAVNKS